MITAAQGFGRAASGGSVKGIDPLTGKILWTYSNWQCVIPVAHRWTLAKDGWSWPAGITQGPHVRCKEGRRDL